jgi:hypothetical protein
MHTQLNPNNNPLLHRLIYLAGPEVDGGGELAGEGGGGVSEEAAEALREEIRDAAAQAKAQKKDEKKQKKRDNHLGQILSDFIRGGKANDPLVILITRLLALETPVTVVLCILSLQFTDIIPLLSDHLSGEEEHMPKDLPVTPADVTSLVPFGQNVSLALSEWTNNIFIHASFHPMKTINALAHHQGVEHAAVQLSALIIQEYFKSSGQEMEFSKVKEFSEFIWRGILKKVHKLADERGLLVEPGSNEEEDDDE